MHFDPDTPVPEPITKAPRTSGSTTVEESKDQERHTRRVEEVEIYVEDDEEVEAEEGEDSYDWNQTVSTKNEAILSEAEMKRRGFYSEGGGPPQVDADELQALDQQAMLAEDERLNDLTVIANLEANDDVEEAMKLDTRIVFDWRYRSGCWVRRARLVAREFRSGAASSIDTFSPTSPLSFIKLLMSLSVTMNLMISVMDISDAFLQVVQKEFVVIEVPAWIREILGREDLVYWKLLRCLPGQRNAALEWHKHFSSLCAEFLFQPYIKGGTIYRHEKGRQFLSVHVHHVDDIILVAEEHNHHKFLEHFSKIPRPDVDSPFKHGGRSASSHKSSSRRHCCQTSSPIFARLQRRSRRQQQGGDEDVPGLNIGLGIFPTPGNRESKAPMYQHSVGTRSHATWVVQNWKNSNKRESCRSQHEGAVQRATRAPCKTHWFA